LRKLQQAVAPGVEARSAHLQLRVHVLRRVRRERLAKRLPGIAEAGSLPGHQAFEELEGDNFLGKGSGQHTRPAQAGQSCGALARFAAAIKALPAHER
jgi:hypothetical protein